jgi:hypothetical protein
MSYTFRSQYIMENQASVPRFRRYLDSSLDHTVRELEIIQNEASIHTKADKKNIDFPYHSFILF